METSALIKKLESLAPGAILETKPFGRSGNISVWLELSRILEVAGFLKEEPTLRLDWLENLSAFEIESSIVLTYFLRSSTTGKFLILRGSVVPVSESELVTSKSVSSIWPMARSFEAEITDLFGVLFEGVHKTNSVLPKNWIGFPLRKSYEFPTEFMNIAHSRVRGQSGQTEQESAIHE